MATKPHCMTYMLNLRQMNGTPAKRRRNTEE